MAANHRSYPSPMVPSPLGSQAAASAFPATSPLDMLASGQSPRPPPSPSPSQGYGAGGLDVGVAGVMPQPRGALLERAVKVSRTSSIRHPRPAPSPPPSSSASSSASSSTTKVTSTEQADRQQLVRDMRAARLSSQGRWMPTPAVDEQQGAGAGAGTGAGTGSSTAREPSSGLIGNAFRDSMASDVSFNTITGQTDEPVMLADDRIADALRGLSLKRRQSIDTVRSSEFGEGGKWDRAWGGSDDDDDDDDDDYDDDDDGYDDDDDYEDVGEGQAGGTRRRRRKGRGANKHSVASMAMSDIDVEGMGASGLYQRTGQQQSQQQQQHQQGRVHQHQAGQGSSASAARGLQLHDVPGKEHIVSLTPSRMHTHANGSTAPSQGIHHQLIAGLGLEPGLSRRDTLRSMMGDIGGGDDGGDGEFDDGDEHAGTSVAAAPRPPLAHTRSDSASTIQADVRTPAHKPRASYSSQASSGSSGSNGRSNAHVYVWPPTPQGSVAGSVRGSIDGGGGEAGRRDTLRAPLSAPGIGMGQRAVVEYAEPPHSASSAAPLPSSPAHPISPSKALSRPLDQPILAPDGGTIRQRGAGHPAGRAPPPAPDLDYGLSSGSLGGATGSSGGGGGGGGGGYSDPNEPMGTPLQGTGLPELGRNRRRAIEEHDGRESLVSDLDVETLRLDGSSGSESWDSRRGSNSTLGTISSDKVRAMRSERDGRDHQRNSIDSIATIQEESQQQQRRPLSQPGPSPSTEKADPLARVIRPPRRSNTDEYAQAQSSPRPSQQQQQRYHEQHQQQQQQQQQQQPRGLHQTVHSPRIQSPLATPLSPSFGQQARPANMQGLRAVSSPSLLANDDARRRSGGNGGGAKGQPAATSQAEAFLTLGITHHESGDLSRSAYYFERSAKIDGGCVVGMCMWGMALREGWGARKDPRKGFEWISKAAARAGELMKPSGPGGVQQKSEAELKAIRSELKLSVYELGKCFCYGWGVKLDKLMALEYFELAAKLGDSDAQAEAGALLAAGKGGCKKDLRKAAMYYRMAEAQGYDTVGLSWIHKDKYK